MVKLRSLKNSDFFTKFGLFSDPFTAKSPNSDSKRKFGPKWQQWVWVRVQVEVHVVVGEG